MKKMFFITIALIVFSLFTNAQDYRIESTF